MSLHFFRRIYSQISAPGSLEAIKQSNIVDIVLKGNPLRNRYRDDAVYVRYRNNHKKQLVSSTSFYHNFFPSIG